MQRLTQSSLPDLPADVKTPRYDRSAIRPGIVHIGIGAFHRGHMAVFIDSVLETEPNWGIIGASLRRPDTKQALAPQNYLYSVSARSGNGTSTQIVGSVLDIIDASATRQTLIDRIADSAIKIVSLTVTEKGYCHDPSTGQLSTNHPDIVNDLIHPADPKSVPGILVAAAERRRALGHGGLTILSCDNLQGNGQIAKATAVEFARLRDASLAEWIEASFTFPSTMVDRIVPAISDADRNDIAQLLHHHDAWPVVTEPFTQWVIEDNFAVGRPELEALGVQMVADVEPFELMKLRMLNGAHSTMAYLGLLAGHELVSDAVRDPDIAALIEALMKREVIPTLDVDGADLPAYFDQLKARFENTALQHRLSQIATDGSQKLPQRTLAPMRERLASGQSVELLCLTLAGWFAFIDRRVREEGENPADALGVKLAQAIQSSDTIDGTTRALLSIEEIFGDDLARNDLVRETLNRHIALIRSDGVTAAIKSALGKIYPK